MENCWTKFKSFSKPFMCLLTCHKCIEICLSGSKLSWPVTCTWSLHLTFIFLYFGKHGGSSGSALGWFLPWMRNLIWCNLIYLPSPSPHIPLEKLTQTQCHGTASDHHWSHLKSTFDLLQVEWQMNSLSNFLSIRHFSCIWLNCLFFFFTCSAKAVSQAPHLNVFLHKHALSINYYANGFFSKYSSRLRKVSL